MESNNNNNNNNDVGNSCFHRPLIIEQENDNDSIVVSVSHSENKGRCAIFNGFVKEEGRRLAAGSVILRCFPMATKVFWNCKDDHCSYCYTSSSSSLMRCSQCRQVRYCSKNCQRKDWKSGHALECEFLQSSTTTTTTIMEEEDDIVNMCLYLRTKCYLKSHKECCMVKSSRWMECGESHWLDMDESSVLPKVERMEEFCRGRPVLSAWKKFHSNNFSIFNSLLTSFAAGVYPCAAILNHSCAPNCILRFDLQKSAQPPILEVVAAKDILPGDELCHCYVDMFHHSIPTVLHQQYGWPSCHCTQCHPSPVVTSHSDWTNPFVWEHPTSLTVVVDTCTSPLGSDRYRELAQLLPSQLLAHDFAAALTTCQHLIACLCCTLQQRQLHYHPLLGVQLFTLADLYEGNGQPQEATRAYQWSRRILRVTHGPHSDLVQRLNSILPN